MKILIPDYMTPDQKDAGEVLLASRLYREALPFLEKRYRLHPEMPRAKVSLGLCLFYHDRIEESEAMVRSVTENHPNEAMGWHALGNIVEGQGRFDESLQCYLEANRLRPNIPAINYGIASNLLRQERCEEAWPYWENGRTILSVDQVPIWEGEDLKDKKILVIREGGYGDILWLLRYLPLLQERGAKVTLYSYSGLRGLLTGHPWVDSYVDCAELMETEGYDYQVSLMSIPAIFKQCPLGMEKPYFVSRHPYPSNGHKRVGLVWRAGEMGGIVRKIRSLTDAEIEPFREVPVEWVNLQLGEKLPAWLPDNTVEIKGWHKTADMIASLDAIVCADTAVCHLAAAMGKPTICILPMNWEFKWRWEKEWYPTLTTFKSTSPITLMPAVEKAVELVREMVC
jgi:hypothetical protein